MNQDRVCETCNGSGELVGSDSASNEVVRECFFCNGVGKLHQICRECGSSTNSYHSLICQTCRIEDEELRFHNRR